MHTFVIFIDTDYYVWEIICVLFLDYREYNKLFARYVMKISFIDFSVNLAGISINIYVLMYWCFFHIQYTLWYNSQ